MKLAPRGKGAAAWVASESLIFASPRAGSALFSGEWECVWTTESELNFAVDKGLFGLPWQRTYQNIDVAAGRPNTVWIRTPPRHCAERPVNTFPWLGAALGALGCPGRSQKTFRARVYASWF